MYLVVAGLKAGHRGWAPPCLQSTWLIERLVSGRKTLTFPGASLCNSSDFHPVHCCQARAPKYLSTKMWGLGHSMGLWVCHVHAD